MAGPAQASEPSGGQPILDVFFSPVAAMDSLARRPRWVLPLILVTAISVTFMVVGNHRGVIEGTIRSQMENSPRMQQVPAEQREQIIEQSMRFAKPFSWVMAVAGPALIMTLASGIFLLLAHLFAAGATFRSLFAVVTHAWLPNSLNQLIAIPILLARDPETVDFTNVVSMANLSFLYSPTEQIKLYKLGASLDLFSFWVIALLTIGIARVSGIGRGAALAVTLAPWLLYVGIFRLWLG